MKMKNLIPITYDNDQKDLNMILKKVNKIK